MAWSPIALRKDGVVTFEGEAEGGGGGSVPLAMHHTTLTDAQIKALPSDGSDQDVAISPIPDAGTLILPVFVALVGPSVAYTNINAAASIQVYSSAEGSVTCGIFEAAGQITQLLGQSGARSVGALTPATLADVVSAPSLVGTGGIADGADLPLYDGLGWVITANNGGDGDWTDGDPANALDVYLFYATIPTS